MDIVEFLTAQYDVDQRRAEAARTVDPTPWTASIGDDGRPNGIRATGAHAAVLTADGLALWDTEGSSTLCMTAVSAEHVAAHDPAFELADIAAKRAIVAHHVPEADLRIRDGRYVQDPPLCTICWQTWPNKGKRQLHPCTTLRLLAAPYADRPGYNPAWKIEEHNG